MNPGTKSDNIARLLEEEILLGLLRSETPLYEVALARRLGVSRTPLREALFKLEMLGLIHSSAFRGFAVSPVGCRDVLEVFELRGLIEAFCVRAAVSRIQSRTLDELRRLTGQPPPPDDNVLIRRYIENDQLFHLTLASLTRNDQILFHLKRFHKQLQAITFRSLREGRSVGQFQEHQRLIDSLEHHDLEQALTAMAEHLAHSRDRLLLAMGKITTGETNWSASNPRGGLE